MLVSDSHRFVFVHVRKAAGTSLRRVLQPLALPPQRSRWKRLLTRAGILRHYHHRVFRPHAALCEAQRSMPAALYADYFKFGFVRNPWERLVSEYEYIRNLPAHPRYRRVVGMAFADFVRYQARRPDAHQHLMLSGLDDALAADFVGHVEHLQPDFDRVCQRLGLPSTPLERLNRSPSAGLDVYFDDDVVAAVADHWRQDCEWFGYQLPQADLAGLLAARDRWGTGRF